MTLCVHGCYACQVNLLVEQAYMIVAGPFTFDFVQEKEALAQQWQGWQQEQQVRMHRQLQERQQQVNSGFLPLYIGLGQWQAWDIHECP